jgi:L-asparaginase
MQRVVATHSTLVKERQEDMNRVLLIHTGGTLGMAGRRPHALTPGAFFRTVRERAPELSTLSKIELELFSYLDSS